MSDAFYRVGLLTLLLGGFLVLSEMYLLKDAGLLLLVLGYLFGLIGVHQVGRGDGPD